MRYALGGGLKIGFHPVHVHLMQITCKRHLSLRQGVTETHFQTRYGVSVVLEIGLNDKLSCAFLKKCLARCKMIRFYIFVVLEITNNAQKAGKSTFVFPGRQGR